MTYIISCTIKNRAIYYQGYQNSHSASCRLIFILTCSWLDPARVSTDAVWWLDRWQDTNKQKEWMNDGACTEPDPRHWVRNGRWIAWQRRRLFDSSQRDERPCLLPVEPWKEGRRGRGAAKWKNESLQATRQKAGMTSIWRERGGETKRRRERGDPGLVFHLFLSG